MDTTEALSTLNTELGDGDDFALTQAEKERAINRAWNDPYVVVEFEDDSLTYANGTENYDVPDEITAIMRVTQKPLATGFREGLPRDAWRTENRVLFIDHEYRYLLRDNAPLYLYGWQKLTTDDAIEDPLLQEYVLALARVRCIDTLINKKTLKFLKNDTTVAELIGVKRQLQEDIREYRKQHRVVSQGL